ncbi:MAG: ornithine cyclodeaminase family protein [Acidisphaera sp.]|nr:ornithine cyclodeaminase family protein [Acidisphaera sp.]
MPSIRLRFLSRNEVEALSPDADDLIGVVESGLSAHGRGEVVMPPKAHLRLDALFNGHFNILPGYVAPIGRAGIKVVGDYVDNWRRDLPSEIALLTLYDPATGVPCCIMDATSLTWQRTGAVTCIGAVHLANPAAAIVGHIGARGTAFSNLRLLASRFPLREIRICSARPATRQRLAARVREELGIAAHAVESAAEAAAGADIVVEATRLTRPEPLLFEKDLAPGSLLVTYGWIRAVDERLPFAMDRLVVDDWEQCTHGGQLHDLIAAGRLQRHHIHAEIGEITCGKLAGRQDAQQRILFWHRGFAVSDIVLGDWIFRRAETQSVGTVHRLLDAQDE